MIGLLEITSIYQRLLVIRRFNTTPMNISENVASHMYFVALLCIALGEGREVDMEKVLGMALSHDLEESYCFPSGTKILVYREGNRDWLDSGVIEKISIGEKVFSYNETTANMEIKEVISIGSRFSEEMAVVKFSDGNELRCTSDHRIYIIDRGWVRASGLYVGDCCIKEKYPNTVKMEVLGIHKWLEKRKVYNIGVKDNLNYFAQGILVHNSGDIITNIKRFHPGIEKALSETSREFLDIIFENVGIGSSMTALWEEYKEGKTEEAKLVKLADCISRVIIMSIELRMGNGYAKKIARNALLSVEESTEDPAIISECRKILESVGVDCNSEHSYERFEK